MWSFLLAFLLAVIIGSGLTLFAVTWIVLTMQDSYEEVDEEELRQKLANRLLINSHSPLMDDVISDIYPRGRDD